MLGDPLLGELARLDLFEHRLHRRFGLIVDDARSARVVAVLGGVADALAHALDAFFVHQVDDELELVQALEVRHLGRVAGFHQRFETGGDERGGSAAEDGLLAEEIGFGFFAEVRFENARAAAADSARICGGNRLGFTGHVLMDRDEARHAAAHFVFVADHAARPLRRAHPHVDVRRRHDRAEVNAEAVGKRERRTRFEVVLDVTHVRRGLLLVGDQDHRDVRALYRLGDFRHFEALALRLGSRLRIAAQADDDLAARVAQIQRVRAPLAPVAENGDRLSFDCAAVDIAVIDGFHGSSGQVGNKKPLVGFGEGLAAFVDSFYAAVPRRPVRATRTIRTRPRRTGVNTLHRD